MCWPRRGPRTRRCLAPTSRARRRAARCSSRAPTPRQRSARSAPRQAPQTAPSPTIFADGVAWSEAAIGDVSRPFYPDGIDGNPPGPLSLPFSNWSVFSTGLQLDLAAADILAGTTGAPPPPVGCGNIGGAGLAAASGGKTPLANGLQIFS